MEIQDDQICKCDKYADDYISGSQTPNRTAHCKELLCISQVKDKENEPLNNSGMKKEFKLLLITK